MVQNTPADMESIAAKYNGELKMYSSTWFNGHAYMPFHIYDLSISNEEWGITIKYEYRGSEFASTSMMDGGAFGDRHLFTIVGTNRIKRYSDFETLEVGFFEKFIRIKRNSKFFNVKSKDAELVRLLNENIDLIRIFEVSGIDPEFSPYIVGKQVATHYELTIRFNIRKMSRLPLASLVNFIFSFPDNK